MKKIKKCKGKEIGILIHTAIQEHIELQEVKVKTIYTKEIINALKSFMLFKKEHPEIILKQSEMSLTSERYKFNGTADCEAIENDKSIILDWKTSKIKDKEELACYNEFFYQTSAYVKLWEEVYNKEISTAYILILAKDAIKYSLQKINKEEIKEYFENIFLPCLTIYNFQKKIGEKNEKSNEK